MTHPAIGALRMVFWGGLVCVLDFEINGFDVLHDFVGMLLVTIGVVRLTRMPIHEAGAKWIKFASVVAVVACAHSLLLQFRFRGPDLPWPLSSLLQLFSLAAVLAFCVSMRRACDVLACPSSAASWRVTTLLMAVVWVLPYGALNIIGLLSTFLPALEFSVDLGPFAVPILVLLLVPLVHLFLSTSRMSRELESGPGSVLASGA